MAPRKPPGPNPNSQILLDQFSTLDLTKWETFEDDFTAYHVGLFYHLEGLRHLFHAELCAALNKAPPVALANKDWCRIVDHQFTLHPFSTKGSLIRGGRFNIGQDINEPASFPSFPSLYIAENYDAAYAEKFTTSVNPPIANGLQGYEFSLRKPTSFSAVNLEIKLANIFDLTKSENLRAFTRIVSQFQITKELRDCAKKLKIKPPYLVTQPGQLHQTLLDENWRHNPAQLGIPSNSQIFARLVREAGFQGILYPSTKYAKAKCIAVFPQNLTGTDSYIKLSDLHPPEMQIHELNSETCGKIA